MKQQTERRVVVTGMGVVAPNGIGIPAFWQATRAGRSGIKPIKRFPTDDLRVKVVGEVSDFLASDYIDRKLANRTDRSTHFVLAAVQEALKDANFTLADEDLRRVGTVIANTLGGVNFAMDQLESLYTRGPRYLSAYTAIAWLQVANVGQTAIRYGLKGYTKTPVNDTVGGLDALGMAAAAIRRGAADVLITGGCEAFLHPFSLAVLGHFSEMVYCVAGNDPAAYRPFDQRAAGLIVAEGAGICLLEEYEHARRRNAPIYGEIVGYGQTNDANGPTPPSPDGRQYARAIRLAMQEAQLSLSDIGYFGADGRAIPPSDQGEVEALRLAFGAGSEQLPVSVPRTMLGHSYAAAGAIDTITALLALRDRVIPPTINCDEPNPDYALNLVRDEGHPLAGRAVLLGGRGIGGMNAALAVREM
ncbi:MAG TPA: beta-ketoacyl-[acyl-carrier-protein] synthase family protein [Ktedonobacteraceae bacterium]|nr:beta-ketoacyl-[acyl-carrier-protein] synthase family protein [Ktedonobacteraceae bacterium]